MNLRPFHSVPACLVTDERRAYSDLGYGRRIVLGAIGFSPSAKSPDAAVTAPGVTQGSKPHG